MYSHSLPENSNSGLPGHDSPWVSLQIARTHPCLGLSGSRPRRPPSGPPAASRPPRPRRLRPARRGPAGVERRRRRRRVRPALAARPQQDLRRRPGPGLEANRESRLARELPEVVELLASGGGGDDAAMDDWEKDDEAGDATPPAAKPQEAAAEDLADKVDAMKIDGGKRRRRRRPGPRGPGPVQEGRGDGGRRQRGRSPRAPQPRLHRARRRRQVDALGQHPVPDRQRRQAHHREVRAGGQGAQPRVLVPRLHHGHERGGEGQGQDGRGRPGPVRDGGAPVLHPRRAGPQELRPEHDHGGEPGRRRRPRHQREEGRVRERIRQGRADEGARAAGQDARRGVPDRGHQQDGRADRQVVEGEVRRVRREAEAVPQGVRLQDQEGGQVHAHLGTHGGQRQGRGVARRLRVVEEVPRERREQHRQAHADEPARQPQADRPRRRRARSHPGPRQVHRQGDDRHGQGRVRDHPPRHEGGHDADASEVQDRRSLERGDAPQGGQAGGERTRQGLRSGDGRGPEGIRNLHGAAVPVGLEAHLPDHGHGPAGAGEDPDGGIPGGVPRPHGRGGGDGDQDLRDDRPSGQDDQGGEVRERGHDGHMHDRPGEDGARGVLRGLPVPGTVHAKDGGEDVRDRGD
ncbi:hypothetical protein THAOC_02264 [Thalassiosira oceanica]|uniref:Uncharacterized protein n=1 Tax=Thalassiosira oceanica TaxID=159749 RepID=K0TM89_THAOC|nr:hypothetical protein THAOC_02264 [Thalassiosira oceanica]|eukprot:EJK75991.1 hypothetical protein THAOC_02264 [Thalassiosira oceanica]